MRKNKKAMTFIQGEKTCDLEVLIDYGERDSKR